MIPKYVGTPCKVLTFTIFHKNNNTFLFRHRRPKFGSRDLGPDYGLTNVSYQIIQRGLNKPIICAQFGTKIIPSTIVEQI